MNITKESLSQRGLIYRSHRLPYNPKLITRAKELRKNMTPAETILWNNFIKTLPYRFVAQRTIDNYIVDFYCSALKLVIEIDGDQHLTEDGKAYDSERDFIIESYGLKILRINNADIYNDFDAVCRRIKEYLPPFSPP